MYMGQGESEVRYSAGVFTESERNKLVTYVVDTVIGDNFIHLGTVTFSMKEVHDACDATMDLKDNMPSKFARKHGKEKFPEANPILVKPQEEWEEVYGNLRNYKRGDVVK